MKNISINNIVDEVSESLEDFSSLVPDKQLKSLSKDIKKSKGLFKEANKALTYFLGILPKSELTTILKKTLGGMFK